MFITKGAAAKGAAAVGATGAGGTGLYYAGDYLNGLYGKHKGTPLLNLVKKTKNGHIIFSVKKDNKDLASDSSESSNDIKFSNSTTSFVVNVASASLGTTDESHSGGSTSNFDENLKLSCNFEFKIVGNNSDNKTTIKDNH